MDILLKRKNYEEYISFLNEKSSDADWKNFLENIKTNLEFLEYFQHFMITLKCIFTLKLFFSKLFTMSSKDIAFQEIVYNLIVGFIDSENEYSNHILIKNLLFVQVLKLCVLDVKNKERLRDLILNKKIEELWFVDLLENFQFFQEIALLYESNGDLNKSITYYKKCGNFEKVKELEEILSQNCKDKEEINETNNNNNIITEGCVTEENEDI